MKNYISYYYNIYVSELNHGNNNYFLYNNDGKYIFKEYDNINFFSGYDDLKYQLIKYSYFFEVIKNKQNNYITFINNKSYILLKLSNINNHIISIFDIKNNQFVDYNSKMINLVRFPWVKLWENKIDYFEEWCYSKQNKYKNMYALFHYFIGISENAVLYLKITEYEEKKELSDELVIAHDRLSIKSNLYDYYDPTNVVIDHASRDISEYIKSTFINNSFNINILEEYLNEHKFSKYGLRLMYARIIFPSFFFDYIDKMILSNCNIDLLYLEARIEEFQIFIKKISIFFHHKYNLPVISWCIKN